MESCSTRFLLASQRNTSWLGHCWVFCMSPWGKIIKIICSYITTRMMMRVLRLHPHCVNWILSWLEAKRYHFHHAVIIVIGINIIMLITYQKTTRGRIQFIYSFLGKKVLSTPKPPCLVLFLKYVRNCSPCDLSVRVHNSYLMRPHYERGRGLSIPYPIILWPKYPVSH